LLYVDDAVRSAQMLGLLSGPPMEVNCTVNGQDMIDAMLDPDFEPSQEELDRAIRIKLKSGEIKLGNPMN